MQNAAAVKPEREGRTIERNTPAPATLEAFRKRLAELSDRLPKRLRQCADYVAAHPDKIAISTVAELAAGAGVQPSAVIRFCKLMGFSGYSEMQRIFRDAYARRWPDYATRIENLRASGEDSPATLLAEFIDAGRASIESLAREIDAAQLGAAVEALAGASMIHIMGLGRAYPVAAYLAYAFEKMEIPTILHDKTGNLDRRHAILPGNVLLAISFAPYSAETIELAAYARERGSRVVAITDALNSPFHRLDALSLTVAEVDVGAFRALSATLTLAIALAVAVGAERRKRGESEDAVARSPEGAVENNC
ncbi:MAG: MurR/RpiR family transcriptional regulator [Alphaproteobacteria bacterium]|nr:MAG: MurR/RpiR family transcriptional regulator [Alphaproteobacteria bacterium]